MNVKLINGIDTIISIIIITTTTIQFNFRNGVSKISLPLGLSRINLLPKD